MKQPIRIFNAFVIFALASIIISSYSTGPGKKNLQASGAPGDITCNSCHNSNALNSGNGSLSVDLFGKSKYVPGTTYDIAVKLSGSTINRYGFQLVALDASNKNAGTITSGSGTHSVNLSGKTYIEHSSPSSTGTWNFKWTAPATDVGNVTFYVAGNAAEAPNGTGGDFIYTANATLTPDVNTSISGNSQEVLAINLFPNPSSGIINLTTGKAIENGHVRLLDNTGKLILQQEVSFPYTIDLTGYSKGMYLLYVNSDAYNVVEKVIVY